MFPAALATVAGGLVLIWCGLNRGHMNPMTAGTVFFWIGMGLGFFL